MIAMNFYVITPLVFHRFQNWDRQLIAPIRVPTETKVKNLNEYVSKIHTLQLQFDNVNCHTKLDIILLFVISLLCYFGSRSRQE